VALTTSASSQPVVHNCGTGAHRIFTGRVIHILFKTPHSNDVGQLPPEQQLIDLCSKVVHIKQQMSHFKTRGSAKSQPSPEIPAVPKNIKVGLLITNPDHCLLINVHENNIRYKVALLLMSTAEETNYHDGPNKPATMIMVRYLLLLMCLSVSL